MIVNQLLILSGCRHQTSDCHFIHLSGNTFAILMLITPYGCMGKNLTQCLDGYQMYVGVGRSFLSGQRLLVKVHFHSLSDRFMLKVRTLCGLCRRDESP